MVPAAMAAGLAALTAAPHFPDIAKRKGGPSHMELPRALREAVDEALEGVPLGDLRDASARLSARYRSETRDGRAHLCDDLAARAYLAARLPATYAAVRASFDAARQLRPDFAPQRMLDVGAGPGTVMFAARDCWPTLHGFDLVESAAPIRALGERLAARAEVSGLRWRDDDVAAFAPPSPFDLVTLAYLLDELSPATVAPLIERLWAATADLLVAVEPGTPAGWSRILGVRAQLIGAGAHILAPCPHQAACPLVPPDWCHFARRVARSRMHLRVKSAAVPWEDEKFIYLVAARRAGLRASARVIAPPRGGGGTILLKLCQDDGRATQRQRAKREGAAFRTTRRRQWGDVIMPDDPDA